MTEDCGSKADLILQISTAVYWRQTNRLISALRAGLVSMIYDKTLGLQPEDLENSAAVTLMGTDIERIAYNLRTVHELWASIVEIAIALWLLGRQVGVACIIPLVIALGMDNLPASITRAIFCY